tara:strand:+ start:35150 stop:35563 length:414 start_codon:yes stop_codon:yes gene_type:complete
MSETPEAPVLRKKQFLILRFLKETEPAKLLIWCAVFIMLTGVFGTASVQVSTGWNVNASFEDWNSGTGTRFLSTSIEPDRESFILRITKILLNLGVLLFGIVSALLPMWTVGRLIGDAVQTNGRLIAESIRSELNIE